jgi:hypothetical protein
VSQNLTATAMLLRGCPEAATPEERRVRQQLKALLEATRHNERRAQLRASIRSAGGQETVRTWPEPTSLSASGVWEGGGAAASAVKSHLGPNRGVQNTIEARRRAESVDDHRDNHSHRHDDRKRGRRHDSDNDRDSSWSPN